MARDNKDVAIFTAYEDTIPWDPATPEKNLLRALLITAIADVRKTGQIRKQALDFFLNPDEHYPFAFLAVCEQLKIDPHSILKVVGIHPLRNRTLREQVSSGTAGLQPSPSLRPINPARS
jgi:hypothetical protein